MADGSEERPGARDDAVRLSPTTPATGPGDHQPWIGTAKYRDREARGMNAVAVVQGVFDELVEMVEIFTDVALGEALAGLLLVIGTILVVLPMAVFGALTLGAVANLFAFE